MIDAVGAIVSILALVCVAMVIWRKKYYRWGMLGCSLCFTINGALNFQRAVQNQQSLFHYVVSIGLIAGGIGMAGALLLGARKAQSAAKGDTKV